MLLFRVFSWNRSAGGGEPGGPFFVPRQRQGSGRHDNPFLYGAFYCSLEPISCIAEALQAFRGQIITDQDLRRPGNWILALARFELSDQVTLVDLDDPRQLHARRVRPSVVATTDRSKTQNLAARIFEENAAGFLWWSTLESLWMNCTLFQERVLSKAHIAGQPQALSLDDPTLIAAAKQIGVHLKSGPDRRIKKE